MKTMQAILVEDEAPLRLATTQTLELGGFTVQAPSSAPKKPGRRWTRPI